MPVDTYAAQEQYSRYAYCRDNGHLEFVAKADKCDKFAMGDQWDERDINALKLAGRPAMTINKIFPTLGTVLGEQIQNRVEVILRPSNGSPSEVADALTKVWMQISQNNQLPWVRSDVFCDGEIRGRGFYDVRLDFTDAMQGEIRISQLNSKNVVIDPDAEEYDPDSWNDVFITKWMTPQDIEVLYSKDDAEYLKSKSGSDYLYGYDSIDRARDRFSGLPLDVSSYMPHEDDDDVRRNIRVLERQFRRLDQQLHFVDIDTGDMRPVPASWERDRIAALLEKAQGRLATTKKLVKRVRWKVTADNVVLHDEWSPYKHFTPVPYFPFFRYGRTVGLVEHLLGPQEILNKTSSQELHIVNTTANSGWTIEENSLVNMSIEELELRGAQTGLVIEYRKGSQPPDKIKPNQVPTGLDRVSMKAEEHIKTISNVSDSMMGFDREDVAAKAIAYKRQAGSMNHSKALDNLERTDWLLARNVLDIVQEYYTEERIITITHEDVTREAETLVVNQLDPATGIIANDLTVGEYGIVITSTPHRATLEDSQFEQARALREIGVAIPDAVLIENSRLSRRAEIIKQISGDKDTPEAQAQAELTQRAQTAEVAKLEAEAQERMADAQLKGARAQEVIAQLQRGDEADGSLAVEMQKLEAEIALDERRLEAELAIKREELEMKREELEMKMSFEREKHAQQLALQRQQAEDQAVTQRMQALRSQAAPSADNKSATPA